MKERIAILGAAGRDFHNFNTFFRNNQSYEVVCFTAEQIPNIADRRYPRELSGDLYPKGIPIHPEKELPEIIKKEKITLVILAYSDLPHMEVMHKASLANSLGADFMLMGTDKTMIKSTKPVISICAVRTGSGKSQTTRKVASLLKGMGLKVVIVRHPMPYGDLRTEACQRFATYDDLAKEKCTVEEREEYEQHISNGFIVYAGVDYEKILREAEKESDVIIWDGGNNDTPFYKTDLHIVVADPLRSGHEISYYPGETNLRMADIIIINKEDSAKKEWIDTVLKNIKEMNPKAQVIHADSEISVERPDMIRGKKVLVVEDGPTLTHGEMGYGAGYVAAGKYGAGEVVEPEKYAVGSIKEIYKKYPHMKKILPAMGYSPSQISDLEKTINRTPCDLVIIGTPMNLSRLVKIKKPYDYVTYNLAEKGKPDLKSVLEKFVKKF